MEVVVVRSNRSRDEVLLALEKVWNTEIPPTLGLLADAFAFYHIARDAGEVEDRLSQLWEKFVKCEPSWVVDQLLFLRIEMDFAEFYSRHWLDCNATLQYLLKARSERFEHDVRQATLNLQRSVLSARSLSAFDKAKAKRIRLMLLAKVAEYKCKR